MKLGRRQPRMDPMHAEFVVNVGIELDDAMRLYRDALDADGVDGELRGRLLTAARQAAVIHRTALWLLPDLRRGLPEPLWPFAAVRALDRVAYGMIALAQEPPDVRAALTREDMDGVLDEDLADWLQFALEHAK